MTPSNNLLTKKQVADLLAVSRKTVGNYSAAGKLAYIRLPGGGLRYDPAEIERFVRDRTSNHRGNNNGVAVEFQSK